MYLQEALTVAEEFTDWNKLKGPYARFPTFEGGVRHLLEFNISKTYSPIVLNTEWPSLWRLILIIFLTASGTIINGSYLGSFYVEKPLRKVGYVYLASIGLADLIITTGVMPLSAFVLISKVYEFEIVCKLLQVLAQGSTYTYSLLYSMIALESYIRLCRTRACYARFLSVPVWLISLIIFVNCFTTSAIGVFMDMDYDYCTRESYGNYNFRMMTSFIFHGLPFMITTILLSFTSMVVRARCIRLTHYKRSRQYDRDYAFTNLMLGCYMFFVAAWIPYLVVVHKYPNATDQCFYLSSWLGLCRSIFTGAVYASCNENFRSAFGRLICYCCCKISISMPFKNRLRRTPAPNTQYKTRTHVVQYALAAAADRAAAAAKNKRTTRL